MVYYYIITNKSSTRVLEQFPSVCTSTTEGLKWFLRQTGQHGTSNRVPSASLSGANSHMVHLGNFKKLTSPRVIVARATCQSGWNLSAGGRRWTTREWGGRGEWSRWMFDKLSWGHHQSLTHRERCLGVLWLRMMNCGYWRRGSCYNIWHCLKALCNSMLETSFSVLTSQQVQVLSVCCSVTVGFCVGTLRQCFIWLETRRTNCFWISFNL